jgi:hypothetical protein
MPALWQERHHSSAHIVRSEMRNRHSEGARRDGVREQRSAGAETFLPAINECNDFGRPSLAGRLL